MRGCSIVLNEATNIVLIEAFNTAFFSDDVGFLMKNEAVDTDFSTNDELTMHMQTETHLNFLDLAVIV